MKYLIWARGLSDIFRRPGFSIAATKIGIVVIAAATELLLVNLLSASQRGEIFYIRTAADLLAVVAIVGLGNAAIYNADKEVNSRAVFGLHLIILAVVGVFGLAMASSVGAVDVSFYWIGSLGLVLGAHAYFQRVFIAEGKYVKHNIVATVPKALTLVALLFLYITGHIGSVSIVLAILVGAHLMSAGTSQVLPALKSLRGEGWGVLWHNYVSSFRYGVRTLLPNLVSAVRNRMEVFLLQYFFGDAVLGVFAVSKSLLAPMAIVTSTVSMLLLRSLSSDLNATIGKNLVWMLVACLALAGLGIGAVLLGTHFGIVPYEYHKAGLYLAISSIGFLFIACSTVIQSFFFAHNMAKRAAISSVGSMVILIGLACIEFDTPEMLLGAIQLSYAALFFVNLIQYKLVKREYNRKN